ncbi:hypothetical protein BWI17_10215 [Betaproteobacteria bacterium GR16-43]|nr:hypothetical protein BWI17_10215 [Betaproteobacteria bacterium GR16-43]
MRTAIARPVRAAWIRFVCLTSVLLGIVPGALALALVSPPPLNNSGSGIMFDVTATNAITITGFTTAMINNTTGPLSFTYSVLTKTGTHVGSEQTPGAWTTIGTSTVTLPAGQSQFPITLPAGVRIAAGATQAFYFNGTLSANTRFNYRTQGPVSTVYVSDANLSLLLGSNVQNFGVPTAGRAWVGTVSYGIGNVPEVVSVAVPANATYTAGQQLDFTVTYDEAVTVTGTPVLSLTVGAATRNATYVSGGGTSALLFRYTVAPGDVDLDGITLNNLSLNGGTIQDASANDALLTLNGAGATNGVLVNTVSNTYTAPSATGSGTITASFTGGGATCTYGVSQYIPLTGNPASPPAGTAPAGVTFPHGLFNFTTTGCTPGSTITMTISYPAALPAGSLYWKYGPTPTNPAAHWYVLPATLVGNTATFTITDGGLGDDDLAANGTIVDQGGPGAGAGLLRDAPTLSEWALLLLAALFAGTAWRRRRSIR